MLRRHRHGEPRQARPVRLRAPRRRAVREPVRGVRAEVAGARPDRAAGHDLPRRAADAPPISRSPSRGSSPCTSGTRRGSPRAPSASPSTASAWPTRSTPSSYVAIDSLVARRRSDRDRAADADAVSSGCPTARTTPRSCTGRSCWRRRPAPSRSTGSSPGPGRMAHISPGPYLPLDAAPMLVGDVDALAARVEPVPGRPLTFRAPEAIRPASARGLELVPFFRVHDSRYMIYWRVATPAAYEARRVRAARERALAAAARGADARSRRPRRAAERDRPRRPQRRRRRPASRTGVPSATPPAGSATS